jgi:DNA-binding transcriptional regulator YiaG
MAEVPDWLRIPESIAATGDPENGNPFQVSDPRHAVWRDATRRAEQEYARVNAEWMAALSPENAEVWFQSFHAARFSVWAKRTVQTVWSDADLEKYDAWLVQYANATLRDMADYFARRPPPYGADWTLLDARNRLAQEIQKWKAEARRYRQEQEADRARRGSELTNRVTADVVKWRKSLIRQYRERNGLTADGFARRVGISDTAVRGMVNEDRTRFAAETQQRLLEKLGLTREQWYEPE